MGAQDPVRALREENDILRARIVELEAALGAARDERDAWRDAAMSEKLETMDLRARLDAAGGAIAATNQRLSENYAARCVQRAFRRRFHVRETFFKHVQATHAHHNVDLSRFDHLPHNGRAFGDQNGIAQAFGFAA